MFTADLLAMIHSSIQAHRRITWLFAGSHHITELSNAPWTSYLISAQTVEVPPFTPAETRLLLTEPLRHSPLFRDDDAKRPRFSAEFWGEDGIERIHAEAGGWPVLVQLIALTCILLLNQSDRRSIDADLLGQVLDQAVVRGETAFHELLVRESRRPGEWDYLAGFRAAEALPPPEDETVRRALRHRQLLVEEENGRWRLRAPLMRRWLIRRT